jgi:hypothetical protein
MPTKFAESDEVIFVGNGYPKHKYHRSTVLDVLIKRRASYPGTKVTYLVQCQCGSMLQPEGYALEKYS